MVIIAHNCAVVKKFFAAFFTLINAFILNPPRKRSAPNLCIYTQVILVRTVILYIKQRRLFDPGAKFSFRRSRLSLVFPFYIIYIVFLRRFVNRGVKKTSLSLRKKTFLPIVERTAYKSRFFMARPPRLVLFFILLRTFLRIPHCRVRRRKL